LRKLKKELEWTQVSVIMEEQAEHGGRIPDRIKFE